MKKILFILSVMLSVTAFARTSGEISIRDVRMERQNENLTVSFKLDVPQHTVRSKYKQILIPVIYNQSQQALLPSIEIMGRNKAKRERQERFLAGNSEYLPSGLIAPEGEELSYTVSLPYAEWMNTLSLRLDRMEEGCCSTNSMNALDLAEGVNLAPKPAPVLAPAELVDTVKKQDVKVRQFTVYFRFNQVQIDPEWKDNASVLRDAADFLRQTKNAKVEIAGFASPEGNEAWNEQLAYKRAESLKHYLIDHGKIRPDAIVIASHSINWEGLQTFMDNSDLQFKSEVLKILNSTDNTVLKNQKLQQLQGGVPYHYLKTKVYPDLRVVSFSITNY